MHSPVQFLTGVKGLTRVLSFAEAEDDGVRASVRKTSAAEAEDELECVLGLFML